MKILSIFVSDSNIELMEIALLADMVKELILDNEEVALPGLGTFVTEVVPASFSDRGYTINPPYRRLSFRERQGSDDKLAQLYSKANGMDLETSRKIISGFVAGVKDELTKKKAVVFPGLGRLRATKENAFFFIPDEDLEIFPYGFGLQPVSLKTHEETPEEVYDAVEKLSAIVDVPEPEVKVPEPIVESVPEQEEMPIELVSPAPAAPETPAPPEETEKTAPAAPASNTAPETQKVRKKDGRRITRIAAACVVGTALLLLVIFIILSRTAPSFTDSLLYTPEELEIINYQDTEK
jgi:nucleoid DNA-binding protein